MHTTNAFPPPLPPRFDPAREANRRGQVTPAQRKKLNTLVRPVRWTSLLLLIVPSAFIFELSRVYAGLMRGREALIILPIGLIALIVVGGMLIQFRRHSTVMADIAAGRIAVGDGQVLWHRTHYQATVAGRYLRVLDGTLALVPGTYRFYYLARSGWLLSHEPIGNITHGNAELASILTRSLGTTPAALTANQHGVMTGGQRLAVAGKMIAGFCLTIGQLLAAGVLAITVVPHAPNSTPGIVSAVLILGALVACGWAITNLADISAPVHNSEGPIRKEITIRVSPRSGGSSTAYYYVLGNMRFKVARTAYMALVEGLPYRIYYLPHSKKVLSIEPLLAAASNAVLPVQNTLP